MAKKKKSKKNIEKFTENPKIAVQEQFSPIITKFNEALRNKTYDLDNNVDNGILPDDSYLDGKEDRSTKFQMLGNILKDPNNAESVAIRDPRNPSKYMLKGVSNITKGGLTLNDDYVIGVIDEDENVNKYLNFEYLHRLYGFTAYEKIDVNDDETRERLHNQWLNEKLKFFPNGIVSTTPVPMNSGSSSFLNASNNEKKKNDMGNFFESLKTIYTKQDNSFLKKAKMLWESSSEYNGKKPRLVDSLKEFSSDNKKLFLSDLLQRLSQLLAHSIFGISLIVISFLRFPDTKDSFRKVCADVEFKNSCEYNTTSTPLFSFLAMNHSEPLRLIKSLPIVTFFLGFSYLLNSQSFLNLKMKQIWTIIFGILLGILFGIYLIYQLFLLGPEHHEEAIGCCVFRTLWGSENENYMIIFTVLLTLVATPIFLALFYWGAVQFHFLYYYILFSLMTKNQTFLITMKAKLLQNKYLRLHSH